MTFENVLINTTEVPLNRWIKTEYKAPALLEDVYGLVRELLIELINEPVSPISKKDIDNKENNNVDVVKFNSNTVSLTKEIEDNLFGAGGYISDFIYSKVHNEPFKPKDIDLFLNEDWIDDILWRVFKNNKNSKSKRATTKYNNTDALYHILGEKLKVYFPDCIWEEASEFHYSTKYISKIFRFTYKGTPIELIVCDGFRILNFDLSFRLAYYSKKHIFINELGLKDINNKVLRVINTQAPISTLIRLYDFKIRYNFSIDSFSLMLLLDAVTASRLPYKTFLKKIKKHKKYTPEIQDEIMSNKHSFNLVKIRKRFTRKNKSKSQKTQKLIEFPIKHFKDYKYSLRKIYSKIPILRWIPMSLTYNKIEYFLKNVPIHSFTFKRPTNWFSDEIFKKGKEYNSTFEEWINYLVITQYQYGNTITDNTIQIIEDAVYKNIIESKSKEFKNASTLLPLIATKEKLNFRLVYNNLDYLLISNAVKLHLNSKGYTEEFMIHINTKNKEFAIRQLCPSDTYLGFVGEVYNSFVEQLKLKLGLQDYTVITNVSYEEFYNLKEIDYSSLNMTPAKLLGAAMKH
ncbi:hypothetical protein [Bacillus toyonensis]|uniref:hypothetical protein n=1 Tax=Bacillus toyonensis TaxID=155322 RepID=UPI002E20A640|nr:hypothetical protein [Bacillus toyonensis]